MKFMAAQDEHLSVEQHLALKFLAMTDRTSMAEQRRIAVRARADEALTDPHIARWVEVVVDGQIAHAVQHLTQPASGADRD